jgi:hypothetical protein
MKNLNILLVVFVCILCSGCFTIGHIESHCGRCCPEYDVNVAYHSAYLDVDSNLIVNFEAKIGEEKEIGEHHIIINMKELFDTFNLFHDQNIKYYYTAKNSQINYFRTELSYENFGHIYIDFKRKAIKKEYYFPVNGYNISKELSFYIQDKRIDFLYKPPYDTTINYYIYIYSVENYVPFRLSPYLLVPAMVVADIVTSPIQILFYLTYESPR